MKFVRNDGGRRAAGFVGIAGDCVTRAIAIATQIPYREVYDTINVMAKDARAMRGRRRQSARDGVERSIYERFLNERGWRWTATMTIGSGCRMHMREAELPRGTLIVRLSKHLTCVVDGTIHDTYDCSRDETRCVYGYWSRDGYNGFSAPNDAPPAPKPAPKPRKPKGGAIREAIEAMGGSIDSDEYADAKPGYIWDESDTATLYFGGDWPDLKERARYGMRRATQDEAEEITELRDENWMPPADAPERIDWPR